VGVLFRFVVLLLSGLLFVPCVSAQTNKVVATNSFINFETAPIHPLDLNAEGTMLAIANLPAGRVELFDVGGTGLELIGSVPVGVDPVTVRFRGTNELWVVNQISDSISIINLPTRRVMATLQTVDAPADVVFAGDPEQAFVSCATSNVVLVFNLQTPIPSLIRFIPIDGDRPKALARSADGRTVYVAIFESGNSSTILASEVSTLNSFPAAGVVDFPQGPHGGINPPPNVGLEFQPALAVDIPTNTPAPRVGLIVKKNSANRWLDDNAGDWTEYVSGTNSFYSGRPRGWDIKDFDLGMIDAQSMAVSYVKGLMNICMAVAVNPVNGRVAVIGTDASNEIRFEPRLNGVFIKSILAVVDPQTSTRTVYDLNPHLSYQAGTQLDPESKRRSLGDPRGVIWNQAGTRIYVAGMGSDNIRVYDAAGAPVGPEAGVTVAEGPVGLALDEGRQRLFVWSRFANAVSVIDLETMKVELVRKLPDPTPAAIISGRRHFYNTQKTSGLGHVACAGCHVDGRFDRLAWDLGAPNGAVLPVNRTNRNFSRFPPAEQHDFHPMKGPMMTQTLQDIIGHEPFHWRGDRDGIEQFNAAFTNLQAASASLTTNEMSEFKAFLATIHFPPNPYRTFSNSFPDRLTLPPLLTALGRQERPAGSAMPLGTPLAGLSRFRLSGAQGCIHCHSLPTGLGAFMTFATNLNRWRDLPVGPNDEHHIAMIGVRRTQLLPFKIPSLRNLHEKIGMSLQRTDSRSGFGFFHDGSVDSPVRFLQESLEILGDQATADLVAFLLCLTGGDLPQGNLADPDRPIGVEGRDAHAAVGKQRTLRAPAANSFLDESLAIAQPATSRVDVVAHALVDGRIRGWFFDRDRRVFRGDRLNEMLTGPELEGLARSDTPLTVTVVARGSGTKTDFPI
jgi:YVTN family beta-propeller protein